jgi:transcriptional regulator with XRE-family HTH domain
MSDSERQDLLLLGKAIRELREQHRVSAGALAARAELSEADLSALESGQVDPDFELLLALAEAIGVRPSAFFVRAEQLANARASRRPPDGDD